MNSDTELKTIANRYQLLKRVPESVTPSAGFSLPWLMGAIISRGG